MSQFHVAGREDIGQEDDFLVFQAIRNLERAHIGERHARVLGLPAGVPAEQLRVSEQPAGREAHDLLDHAGVRIGVIAQRPEIALAEEAVAARDRERNDHAITDRQVLHLRPQLDDLAHELMAEDVAGLERRDVTAVQVQIRSADAGGGDFDDGVTRVEDLGLGHVLHPHVFCAAPGQGFHWGCSSSVSRR
jgi:hypothetical protein